MKNISEEELLKYAKEILKDERIDHIDVMPDGNMIDIYIGVNSYTLIYGKSNQAFLNPTISERQIELLENKPELFMDLNRRYFMDNIDSFVYSEEKARKLIAAASRGLEKMPISCERAELQNNIMEKVNGIKEEIKNYQEEDKRYK